MTSGGSGYLHHTARALKYIIDYNEDFKRGKNIRKVSIEILIKFMKITTEMAHLIRFSSKP